MVGVSVGFSRRVKAWFDRSRLFGMKGCFLVTCTPRGEWVWYCNVGRCARRRWCVGMRGDGVVMKMRVGGMSRSAGG